MKVAHYIIFLLLLACTRASAQDTARISGTILDNNNEPIINAVVQAIQNTLSKGGGVTDFDGHFTIAPMAEGVYTLEVRYVGYKNAIVKNVRTSGDSVVVKMEPGPIIHCCGCCLEFRVPLIDKFEGGSSKTIVAEELEKMGH